MVQSGPRLPGLFVLFFGLNSQAADVEYGRRTEGVRRGDAGWFHVSRVGGMMLTLPGQEV